MLNILTAVSVSINTTSAVQRDIISDYLEVLEINEISKQCINRESAVHWASEASPTLGCSIEISRDIYIYMCMCLSYVKLTA